MKKVLGETDEIFTIRTKNERKAIVFKNLLKIRLYDILGTLGEDCTLGVFPAPAFAACFPPVAPEFHQRTHRVRLKNLGTTDKKIISQNQAQKDSASTLV